VNKGKQQNAIVAL